MKKLLFALILFSVVTSSLFAQGEYITNTAGGISVIMNMSSSDNADSYSGQFALSANRYLDIGFGVGKTTSKSYYYYSQRSANSFTGYLNLNMPKTDDSPVHFSITGAFVNSNSQLAFIISPKIFLDINSDVWNMKLFFNPGYFNIQDVSGEENMFLSYGISPYLTLDKKNVLFLRAAMTRYDGETTMSGSIGILFGIGKAPVTYDVVDKKKNNYYR